MLNFLNFFIQVLNMGDSKQRKAFERIAEEASKSLEDSLKKLILYGSVAREEESSQSDLDLFAVVENRRQKNWVVDRASQIGVEYGVLVSAIVKTQEEYEEMKNSSFREEVEETGIAYV